MNDFNERMQIVQLGDEVDRLRGQNERLRDVLGVVSRLPHEGFEDTCQVMSGGKHPFVCYPNCRTCMALKALGPALVAEAERKKT